MKKFKLPSAILRLKCLDEQEKCLVKLFFLGVEAVTILFLLLK